FMSGGAFLYVPAGVELSVPGRTMKWLAQPGGSLFAHTLVVVERGATVTVIDDYLGPDDVTAFDCSAAELFVRDGAKLSYVLLQRLGAGVASFTHLRGETSRDATIDWLVIATGGKSSRVTLTADLKSPGATNIIKGLCFGDRSQQFDVHSSQDHRAPHTTSDLLFKNVLKDKARSAFSGLIRVAPGAQRADAYLANRNLLLSDKARADSIPTLEIEANDVRCTHGATVGPIDEQQVFYLMARGIPRPEAVQMIVEGFLEPIISGIPVEAIRSNVEERIAARLTTV
ncbi:MAG: Fe-S cluster assembly protein SufD, partial [Dehalococcoidia bacterium]|nr:Fe-S cluster assembly protein SufD [Dehalococcoidia bacterium]